MNEIPETIGRYQVERLLGQGAMGSVYLGRDLDLDRAVAIKTVRHLDLEEKRLSTFLERFRNEARAAARLSHPAIVAVYDVGEDEGVGPYLVFEYVAGSTLKQILRGRGPLAPDAVVRLGRQIAAALDTAHAAGVIHRDVKPDNILVSATGDAKLADFGVARVPDAALTKEGQFLGTPCYAAPETLDEGRYGPHSDLFSFAAVMYEAVTAVRAFPGDDAISVANHVVHDDPAPPSAVHPDVRIPKEVDRVIMRGLNKEHDQRYDSAMSFVDALASAYVSTGVLDRDPTGAQILPVPEPAPRRSSGWVFYLVTIALLAVGVAFVAAFLDTEDPDPDPGVVTDHAPDAGVSTDAAPRIVAADAGLRATDAAAAAIPDSGVAEALDSGVLDDVSTMSPFERDEAAKDAVDAARQAIQDGDLDGAEAALRRARLLDPGNDDISPLEEELRRLR